MIKRSQLLSGLSLLQFALFIPLTWWVHRHPQPPDEVRITQRLQKAQPAIILPITNAVSTVAGEGILMNILVVPVAAIMWKKNLRLEAMMTLFTSWCSGLARQGIKLIVKRPRPNPLLVHTTKHSRKKSFPSGHVASSVDFWGWLLMIGMRRTKGKTLRQRSFLCVEALCILVVGPTRILLGDHWSTDVLGGYLFGGGWLCLSLQVYDILKANTRLLPAWVAGSSKP